MSFIMAFYVYIVYFEHIIWLGFCIMLEVLRCIGILGEEIDCFAL